MQSKSQGTVLVVRVCLHDRVLWVMGHGFQNKWKETAVSMCTQELWNIIVGFY